MFDIMEIIIGIAFLVVVGIAIVSAIKKKKK